MTNFDFDLYQYQETIYSDFIVKDNPVLNHFPLLYYNTGLVGECWELVEETEKYNYEEEKVLSELGDVVFYISLILHQIGIHHVTFPNYKSLPKDAQFWSDSYTLLMYVGEMNRQLEKYCRKTKGFLTNDQRLIIGNQCMFLFGFIQQLAFDLIGEDYNLEKIMEYNVQKLTERKNANLI